MARELESLTLGQALTGALVQGLALPVLFVGGFAATTAVLPTHDARSPDSAPDAVEIRQQSGHPRSARDLIAAHDCWRSTAPADVRGTHPGHAVVTWPGDDRPTYGDGWTVHMALEHTFNKPVLGFEVHAFCR